MLINNIEVFGFKGALRGMRNALNSWGMADTEYDEYGRVTKLGDNDRRLMMNLTRAGQSHRKFLRMVHVQMDVEAPLYWWKDYDTYKVATVANSCSTMHKIHDKEFTIHQFAHETLDEVGLAALNITVDTLNHYRDLFLKSGKRDTRAWRSMIQLLPSSYKQLRTIDLNCETILALIQDRRFHKLNEFIIFTTVLKEELPFMKDIVDAYDERFKNLEIKK